MTIVVGELARRLSDSLVLPFNYVTYANEIQKEFNQFALAYLNELTAINISLSQFSSAVGNFSAAAKEFHTK